MMRRTVTGFLFSLFLVPLAANAAETSKDTQRCLGCHRRVTPGIVADWERSRHSKTSVKESLALPELERRVSVGGPPAHGGETVVGCAECHTRDRDKHADTFPHNGFEVHVVVTPEDCAGCHPSERMEYADNLMAHAYGNLFENPVYADLAHQINGVVMVEERRLIQKPASHAGREDSCMACHGTKVEVTGFAERLTAMGKMTFPVLAGWPNVGVGRVNPDGSKGSCTSCHTRHEFSIAMARKPATCSQCHKGPDVPAYPVYEVSKHGNLYKSVGSDWNFTDVPWQAGRDFTAPTCAVCHVSLLADNRGDVVVKRTHRMNDRTAHRLFGPIYAIPHPKGADTTIIRNADGQPLPTTLTGELAKEFLISEHEMATRQERMKKICAQCHSAGWYGGHFERFETVLDESNEMVRAASTLILRAWEEGLAKIGGEDSLFDEPLERHWVQLWLFHANSIRFATAMGGADYGVFANGRWQLAKGLKELREEIDKKRLEKGLAGEKAEP